MLKNLLCWILLVACFGCVCQKEQKSCLFAKQECKKEKRVFRHVLLFKFRESTTPEQIKEIVTNFASLPGKIDAIKCFEWGTNVSVENRSEGFTHCFIVTFADEAGLDEYMNHPDLKAFRKDLGGPLEKYIAIDYWTNH